MKYKKYLALGVSGLCLATTMVSADSIELRWSLAPGDVEFLANDNAHRGAGYDATRNQVVLVSRTAGLGVYVLDGDTGTLLHNLDTTDVLGGTFALSMIGVAEDGVIYGGNLSTSAVNPNYKLYRWADDNPLTLPTVAFEGDPGLTDPEADIAQRWGDSMDVRGSGTDTQILLASRSGTQVSILTTTDGVNFTANPIEIAGITAGDVGLGIAFGQGNTFWGKAINRSLFLIEFNLEQGTGTILSSHADPAVPNGLSPLGSDPSENRLAGINVTTHTLTLYDVSDPSEVPVFVASDVFPTLNPNVNGVGAVDVVNKVLMALDTNNGLAVYDIIPSTQVDPPTLLSQPASQTILEGASVVLTVSPTGTAPFEFQWFFNDEPIEGATTSTLNLDDLMVNQTGEYYVSVSNAAGSVNSEIAILTVRPTAGRNQLQELFTIAPGDRDYMTTGNTERGMDYNPASGNVLMASRAGTPSIHVLNGLTGEHLHSMNTDPDFVIGGTFTLSLVGVADDGVVFGSNLTLDVASNVYTLYRWASDSPDSAPGLAFEGDPAPGNTQRWGDTLAVRGAGVNTQILISSRSGALAVLFTTIDGENFLPTVFPNAGGGLGLAFGEGNTFWAKSPGGSLLHFSFDIGSQSLTLLEEFQDGQFPGNIVGIGVDPEAKLLAGIQIGTPDNLKLYDLNSPTVPPFPHPPLILEEVLFPSDNANLNNTGVVAFGNKRLYALDTNNGLIAFSINDPVTADPVTLGHPTLNGTTLTLSLQGTPSATYAIQSTSAFDAWTELGTVTLDANGTGTFSTTIENSHTFYRGIGK